MSKHKGSRGKHPHRRVRIREAVEKVRDRVRMEADGFADPGEDCREHSLMVAKLLKEIYDALDAALGGGGA